MAARGFCLYSHIYPEDLLYPMGARDIETNLAICTEILAKFGKSAGKNLLEYETLILEAKLGYGKAKIMPRRVKSNGQEPTPTVSAPRTGQARWINATLSEEHVAAIEGTEISLEDIGARLLHMATLGWDITIKRDDKSGGYSCFGFADDPHSDTGRIGLSGWSSNPTDAAFVFVYKYYDVLGGVIPVVSGDGKRRFR